MARLKNWRGNTFAKSAWTSKYRDRDAQQIRFLVRTTSQRTAAALVGQSLYEFQQYCGETGNDSDITELDKYPPSTLLVAPLDPGGTINGETGWQVAADLPHD